MSTAILVIGVVLLGVCSAEPPRPQRIRFPGPAQNGRQSKFFARQEVAAPYPPSGQRPEPPFELPTENAASFPVQQPTYLPPDQTYGPPEQTYGPPEQTYGPPEQTYGPPEQTYGPPEQTYEPVQIFDPPAIVEDNNALPQTASIIDRGLFFPQTSFALPRVERLIAFRPVRHPAPLRRRPSNVRHPAKLQQRPNRRPQPAKLIVSVGTRPEQGFAQLPPIPRNPIFAGERLIAYSDRKQSW